MSKSNNLVGFIGTGIMGKPMARNLIKAGYKLTVYDINKNALEELKNDGAGIASSIAELSRKNNTIITMLPNSPESMEVILGDSGIIKSAEKGTLVIDMSSIDPTVSIQIGKKLNTKNIDFLDAPVSGGGKGAIDGTLAIMVGGKKEIFNKAVPLFRIMGSSYTLVGEVGAGNFTKLSNQIIVAVNIAAVCEALILAKKAGLSPISVYNAIKGGLAGSQVLDSKAPMMIDGNFTPGFKIKFHKKDMQNVLNAGASLNIPLPLSLQLLEMLKSLTSSGYEELDHSGIIKFYESISGVVIK